MRSRHARAQASMRMGASPSTGSAGAWSDSFSPSTSPAVVWVSSDGRSSGSTATWSGPVRVSSGSPGAGIGPASTSGCWNGSISESTVCGWGGWNGNRSEFVIWNIQNTSGSHPRKGGIRVKCSERPPRSLAIGGRHSREVAGPRPDLELSTVIGRGDFDAHAVIRPVAVRRHVTDRVSGSKLTGDAARMRARGPPATPVSGESARPRSIGRAI